MNNFAKLRELQEATKKNGTSKKDYIKSLKEVFNINAKVSDIHKTYS